MENGLDTIEVLGRDSSTGRGSTVWQSGVEDVDALVDERLELVEEALFRFCGEGLLGELVGQPDEDRLDHLGLLEVGVGGDALDLEPEPCGVLAATHSARGSVGRSRRMHCWAGWWRCLFLCFFL